MTSTRYKRLWAALMLAAVLAAVLLALASPATRPADAAQFKFVTKTFSKNGIVEIPDDFDTQVGPASPYPAARFVSGFPNGAKIVDVNLTLRDFSHGNPDDVDMMLTHKGLTRTVFSDTGAFFDVNDLTITLDDQAQATPPSGNPLTSGKFKPTNNDPQNDFFASPSPDQSPKAALAGFDGLNPEGPWKLYIMDDDNFGFGSLGEGWSLKIRAKFPAN